MGKSTIAQVRKSLKTLLAISLMLILTIHLFQFGVTCESQNLEAKESMGWSENIELSEGSENYARQPSIAVSSGNTHVVWSDYSVGNREIFYRKSLYNGAVWNDTKRLTFNDSYSSQPIVVINGSNVHVVWTDLRSGFSEIYYKKSTDNGDTWTGDIPLTSDDGYTSQNPDICVCGSNVHVVWEDHENDNQPEIYYKNSTDGGGVGVIICG